MVDMDKSKYQYEGLKWLYELELLNHPQVINQLKFNILMASKRIKEVELLIYRENKSMLVLLELTWFGRNFANKRQIFTDVQEILHQLLPSFKFRVTDDPRIMEMAVERVKRALTGGQNENVSNPSLDADQQPAQQTTEPVAEAKTDESGSSENSDPGSKESSEIESGVQQATSGDDRKEG